MNEKKPKSPLMLWLVSFLVMLSLLITGTVAWFQENRVVSIQSPSDENLAVQVNAGDLLVAVSYRQVGTENYGEYTNYSDYSNDVRINAQSPTFIDVSGGGDSLWFPTYLDENDEPVPTNPESWVDVTDGMGYCLTLKLKFRTAQSMSVYLDKSSFVSGLEDIVGGNIVRSSANCDFSCDGIAGAVRVAFLEPVDTGTTDEEGSPVIQNQLRMVWVPNDQYRLLHNAENDTYSYSISGPREDFYGYFYKENGVMHRVYYNLNNDYAPGNVAVGNGGLADGAHKLCNMAKPLISFEANGAMQEKELLVRIWFEGTDSEAHTLLDTGIIKYCLNFAGIVKEDADAETEARVNGIGYNSAAQRLQWGDGSTCEPLDGVPQILYSYNCIDWSPYALGTGSHLDLTNEYVYVRACETADNRVSGIKTVPLR